MKTPGQFSTAINIYKFDTSVFTANLNLRIKFWMCLSQLEPRGAHYLESRNGRLPGCQRRDQMPGSLQNSIGQFYDNEIGCSLRADR